MERRTKFGIIVKRLKKNFRKYKSISGIKIQVSGRPMGNKMSVTKWFRLGKVPVHSFKCNVSYANQIIRTRYGICSVKVWVNIKNT